jgi:hypothetical protein
VPFLGRSPAVPTPGQDMPADTLGIGGLSFVRRHRFPSWF